MSTARLKKQSTKKVSEKVDNKKYQSYESKVSFELRLNKAIFKILENYFNVLSQDKKLQKEQGIKIVSFTAPFHFVDTIAVTSSFMKTIVTLEHEGLLISIIFDHYKSNGSVYYDLFIYSNQKTNLQANYIYNTIFANAIQASSLKGSYFTMPRNQFDWEVEHLEPRGFNDIFLPDKIMEDLNLYVKIFESDENALRYLFVGNPGTGKTESCLVLTNELNKMGVTVIKTSICEQLKEKMQLAEILKPSIVILDDIDLALGSRNTGGFSKYLEIFLDVLDGTEKLSKQVGIVSTTNSAHLLDLAAQRPGRFDKVVLFDNITKDNIKNIIIKSLKYNFDIDSTSPTYKVFTEPKVVNEYYDAFVTGAYIYNSVNMILLRVKTLHLETKFNSNWLANEIKQETKMSDKIKQYKTIEDKLQRERKQTLGFTINGGDNECKEVCGDEVYTTENASERRSSE